MQYVDCGNGGRQTVYDVRWNLITMSTFARMAIISARPSGAPANGGLRFVCPQICGPLEDSEHAKLWFARLSE